MVPDDVTHVGIRGHWMKGASEGGENHMEVEAVSYTHLNAITGKTYASFEPMLDYCVVKIPRLPFDKFITAKRTLTTQMRCV